MRAGNHIELRLGHAWIVWQPPTTRAAALPDNRPMLLAVDIGNTQTHVGAFDGEELAHDWRLGTDPTVTSDELAATLGNLLELEGIGLRRRSTPRSSPRSCPSSAPSIARLCERHIGGAS